MSNQLSGAIIGLVREQPQAKFWRYGKAIYKLMLFYWFDVASVHV